MRRHGGAQTEFSAGAVSASAAQSESVIDVMYRACLSVIGRVSALTRQGSGTGRCRAV